MKTIQDRLPKSRLTLKYKTEVNGQKEDITLPFRLKVLGDLSQGTSKDRQQPLDEREVRTIDGNNLNATMKDMGINLSFSVNNKINPQHSEELHVNLPIESMRDFTPDQIVENVPQLKALMHLKSLLEEFQSYVDNKKQLRTQINMLLQNAEARAELSKQLEAFEVYRLPNAQ